MPESRRGGGSGFSKKEINELKGMFGLRVIKNKTADELKEEL